MFLIVEWNEYLEMHQSPDSALLNLLALLIPLFKLATSPYLAST